MRFFDNILRRVGLFQQQEVRQEIDKAYRRGQMITTRSFNGAQVNRLTEDLSTVETAINQDIRSGGRALRARARQLVINNGYARRFFHLFIANVIGPNGHNFQSNVTELVEDPKTNTVKREPDVIANSKIQDGFGDFGKAEHCSVNGRLTYAGICKQLAGYYVRDGEAFLRRIINKNAKYGLQLQVIPPETIDELYNAKLSNGNVVVMGVELDQWRRPVAYYIRPNRPENEIYGGGFYLGQRERIPAEEMIHWFDPEHANQTRGFTRYASVMLLLHWVSRYEGASVLNANLSAAKMGFFGDGDSEETEELTGDGKTESGDIVIEGEPGTFTDIGKKKFFPWDPQYPTAQHEMFIRTTLRGVASGFGCGYSSFANDYVGSTYTSLRAEQFAEQRMWKNEQQKFIDQVQVKVFGWWLSVSLMRHAIMLSVDKFDKFNQPVFTGPRWISVDPVKDAQAARMDVESLFASPFDIAAQKGERLEQIYQDNEEAQRLAEKHHVKPVYGNSVVPDIQDEPAQKSEDLIAATKIPSKKNGK